MTRLVDLSRQRALCDELWGSGEGAPPGERAQLEHILTQLAHDRARYSDLLELSLGQHGNRVDARRYSYALPAWRAAHEEAERFVRGWAQEAGSAAAQVAEGVLRAARHRAVQQVLVGYARDLEGPPRVKFYLQFADAAGPRALELARAVVGLRRATSSDALPLHLLGLDVGPEGLRGARLYFVRDAQPAEQTARLCEGWSRALREVLVIHRVGGPEDEGAAEPCELDFAPAQSGLAWDEVWRSPAMARYEALRARFAELGSRYALRPRRVSLSLDARARATVYYVLDESEPSVTKPPSGG